jgi:hypothetical protein
VSEPRRPIVELRSPAARALVPVLGGVLLLGAMALVLWGIAAYLSGDGQEASERLAPSRFQVGSVESAAAEVAESGPILFPGLDTTTGERTMVLAHEGDEPAEGWRLYYAFPADRDRTCTVEQVQGTDEFVDCEGRTLDVSDLAPPDPGVNPVVEDRRTLYIDLSGISS